MTLEADLKNLGWEIWNRWREHGRRSGSMELTAAELDYLYALLSTPDGMRLTQLAALLRVSKASASTMVSKLEARGYLHRSACPEDGRAVLLHATDKARHIEKEEHDVYAETAAALRQGLDEHERRELERLLDKACKGFRRDD
ncbi:MarR family winged helix-turn-helix transcriptional regulator [Halomonas salipaludis]|uniref:MarR family transcriptional regulator n=1 Tax=Halomonas salipaludis TaxID=2032625 RepID=A0A2A2EV60_9GAMM|nr:MarR family transcriptional regulator [Halomonas salipaludis]PAU76163.1 MarR family transcriptional regulator [Halomonas salipaludis]